MAVTLDLHDNEFTGEIPLSLKYLFNASKFHIDIFTSLPQLIADLRFFLYIDFTRHDPIGAQQSSRRDTPWDL
jgi:hypothetical protein